jgi:hypothetical protein
MLDSKEFLDIKKQLIAAGLPVDVFDLKHFNEWDTNYNLLLDFKNKHGHCNAHQKKDKKIGKWVAYLRARYMGGFLPQDKIKQLESIGFVWDVSDAMWHSMYTDLIAYKSKHGHTNPPDSSGPLGKWVNDQRYKANKSKLLKHRIQKLNEIGFEWAIQESRWIKKYNMLQTFKKKYGHCDVPDTHPQLGHWIGNVRKNYKNNKISSDRVSALNKLGFIWEKIESLWIHKFNLLLKYKSKYGHCNVQEKHDKSLSVWVGTQRTRYRRGQLAVDRITKLESIGFVWRITTRP